MQKDAKMIPENISDSEKGSANVNPRLIFVHCFNSVKALIFLQYTGQSGLSTILTGPSLEIDDFIHFIRVISFFLKDLLPN